MFGKQVRGISPSAVKAEHVPPSFRTGDRDVKDLILSPGSKQKRRSRAGSLCGIKATNGKEDEMVRDVF